jgi:hypothetical protein
MRMKPVSGGISVLVVVGNSLTRVVIVVAYRAVLTAALTWTRRYPNE